MKALWKKLPRWKKRKILSAVTLVIIAILAFLTNKVWPFSSFVNILAPVITVFLWGILIIAAYYCFYLFFEEKKNKISLVEDKEQAEKFCEILKNKCKEVRKALMITAPWGFGKTDFYEASLRPLLEKAFPHHSAIEVSCFGMSSSDDLIAQILNKQFFLEYFMIFFHKIGLTFSGTSYFKRSLIPSGLIIMVDDFERFCGDYIELLGFFDYLIREKNCYIVVLCDEDKINENTAIPHRHQYKDFSEKIIEKHPLKTSPEQMLSIMESQKFTLNDKGYLFSEAIRNHFLKLVEATDNFRIAQGAWIDIREISSQLIDRLEKISDEDISQETKKEGLKKYFEYSSFGIIKATFIKNAHKKDAYFDYCKEHKDYLRSGLKGNFSIQDRYLAKIFSIKLSEFDYLIGNGFNLPKGMELYLEGEEIVSEEFINEVIIDSILISDVEEKLDDCSDKKISQNQEAIKKSHFNYFKFVKLLSDLERRYNNFIAYKVIVLKFKFELNEAESKLMTELEEKFTKKEIAMQIYNILHTQQHLELPGLLKKIDPEREFLKQLEKEYPIDTE